MATSARTFVLRHTHLRPVPGLEEIRLHLADDVLPLTRALQIETDDPDPAIPYWAFAWAGGLAIGRYLRDHPETATGRRVFDLASGSGLCAIAAMHAGAAEATGADVDAFAAAAAELNARANGHRVTVVHRDVLDEEPPDVDIVLAGDCWYDARLAGRVLPWLQRARDRGIDVLVGDPGPRPPCGTRPALAAAGPRPRDRPPRRGPGPPPPSHRRAGRTRLVQRPVDDRARGPRSQPGSRLCLAAGRLLRHGSAMRNLENVRRNVGMRCEQPRTTPAA